MTSLERHPELFARDQYVDPASRKRLVPMEALCLGYMRTGTACKYQPVEQGALIFVRFIDLDPSHANSVQHPRHPLLPLVLSLQSHP